MDVDWESFNRSMGQWAPLFKMMLQRKMEEERVRRWLEKSKEEHKSWGEQQRITQERGAQINRKEQLVQFGRVFFKDKPHALSQFVDYVNRLFPDQPMGAGFVPENLQEMLAGARGATTDAIMAEQAAEPITQETVADLVSSYGYEMPTAGVRSILGERKATADRLLKERTLVSGEERAAATRALTARGLDIEESLVPVREREVSITEEKLAFEKKGKKKPSKKDEDRLKILDKKESVLKNQLEDLSIEDMEAGKEEIITASIESIRKEKMALLDKMEASLNMEKINRVLSRLRAEGITAKGMEQYKETFMKREDLSEGEYQYIKANL